MPQAAASGKSWRGSGRASGPILRVITARAEWRDARYEARNTTSSTLPISPGWKRTTVVSNTRSCNQRRDPFTSMPPSGQALGSSGNRKKPTAAARKR